MIIAHDPLLITRNIPSDQITDDHTNQLSYIQERLFTNKVFDSMDDVLSAIDQLLMARQLVRTATVVQSMVIPQQSVIRFSTSPMDGVVDSRVPSEWIVVLHQKYEAGIGLVYDRVYRPSLCGYGLESPEKSHVRIVYTESLDIMASKGNLVLKIPELDLFVHRLPSSDDELKVHYSFDHGLLVEDILIRQLRTTSDCNVSVDTLGHLGGMVTQTYRYFK